ncbi:MAG: hypothetical protein H6603_04665 [Flavobacteriales bacterium]|nr:hypothetical protein [Flavobacteriales bacterium]
MEWQNWAGNIRFDAKRMAQPTSTEEVQELLKTSNGRCAALERDTRGAR